MPVSIREQSKLLKANKTSVLANESAPIGFMGCGISSNSPVVTKSRLAGRTSRVEDCSPLEKPTNQLAHSSASLNSLHHPSYASTDSYLKNAANLNGPAKSPSSEANSPDLADDPMIANPMGSIEQQNLQFNPHFAKSQRGITAVISKTLSNSKSIEQLEGESDRQTGKESVETNNSRNDSNYGSSYSAEMSKTPVGFICFLIIMINDH